MLTHGRVVLWLARAGVVIGALALMVVAALIICATGAPLWEQAALALFCGPCIGAAMWALMDAIGRGRES